MIVLRPLPPPPLSPPPLGPDEAHVWLVALNQNADRSARLESVLSADERARAGRYKFARDRDRFIAGRGALHFVLSGYLACSARTVAFVYGAQGKPALADPNHAAALRFNVSHSHDTALIAVSRRREVGVDIERITADCDWEAIASSSFSPSERECLATLPPDERPPAFFVYWTLKEAYLKATGEGLLQAMRDVTVAPGNGNRFALFDRDGSHLSKWSLQQLNINGDYAAALAISGGEVSVQRLVFAEFA